MNSWTLFFLLLSIFPAWTSVSRRSSATFSYNQNRRHDYFHNSQDGSHGYNYQYGNPESDVHVGLSSHPSYHDGHHPQPSYNERHPEANHDSEWSSSEPFLSFDRPRNVNPMGLPPVHTPNPTGGEDTKLHIDQRSPWYNAALNGRPVPGIPTDPKNPKVIEDVGGHVYTIPQYPLVDARAASMKYSNQNNDELFKNLYATHPDIARYVNPTPGPINVLGVPHNLRFENNFGSVNGFRPQEYEGNKNLPTPVVDTGVRKGSGYIDDDQKFHRIYDYHPHIHGYVNPEKNTPINVFGVPPNLRFPHPNGHVDGFRPPEVETNKFLTGPAVDHVQPIGDRPIHLRFKDHSASISAHPPTVQLNKNSNRAIYQSSQSQQRDHVLRPDFMDFQEQHKFWDHDQEPVSSASRHNEFVVNKPGAVSHERRPVEKSVDSHRPGNENVYNPKQRLHALAVQQKQELAEVNYADKQKSNDQKSLEGSKISQQPYAQYSQGPIRYAYPRLQQRSRLSNEENFKYYISPTTYRPPFFKNIDAEAQSPSRNQNSAQHQHYNQLMNDQQHSRFSYQDHQNTEYKQSNVNGQSNNPQKLRGEGNSGFSYANYNERALPVRSQMPGYLDEPSTGALSINNVQLHNPDARSDYRNSQGVPNQRPGKTFSPGHTDNRQPASFERPNIQSSFELNEFQKESSHEQPNAPKNTPTYTTSSEQHHFIYKRPPLDHNQLQTEIKINIQQRRPNPQLDKNFDQYDKDSGNYDNSYPIGEQLNVLKYDGASNSARTSNIFASNDSRPNSFDQNSRMQHVNDGNKDVGTFRYSPTTEYASYQQAPTRQSEGYKGDPGDSISDSYQAPNRPLNSNEERINVDDGRGGERNSYGNAGLSSPNNIQSQVRDSYSEPIRDSYNGHRDSYGNAGIAYPLTRDNQPSYGGSYNGHQDSYRNTGISYVSSNQLHSRHGGSYDDQKTGTLYRNNQHHGNSYNGNQGPIENSGISYASSNQYRPRHGGSYDVQRNNYRNAGASYRNQPKQGGYYDEKRDSYRNAGTSYRNQPRQGGHYDGYRDSYGNPGVSYSAPYQYQPKIMHDHGSYDSYGYTNQGNNAGYGRDTYNGPSGDYSHQYGHSYGHPHTDHRHGRPYNDYFQYKPKTFIGHLLPKLIKYAYGIGLGLTKEITFHQPDYGYLNYGYGHGYQNRHGYSDQGYNNHGYINHGYTHPTKGVTIKLGLSNLLNKAFNFLHRK